MHWLLIGKRGQLGNTIYKILFAESSGSGKDRFVNWFKVANVDLVGLQCSDLFDDGINKTSMDSCVVNAAAMTAVDGCETDECRAFEVNALGPKYLAEHVARQGGTLLHVSTDYVFPGTDPSPRKENDPVCPINAYGRTKWAGEVFVRALCPKYFIVRTAWLYGLHGKNFVKTILKKARETGRISVVADQYGSPTFANDLAEALLQLAQTEQYGTYHCTNAGVCSWFELASAAVDMAGIPCEKEAITTEEYRRRFPQSARRPMYSALDNTKIAGVLGKPLRPWREALEEFIDALQKEEAQHAGN